MRLLSALLLVVLAGGPAFAWDKHAMNIQIDQTNFEINEGCSGTLIDAENGYILTANHCIKDQTEKSEIEKVSDGEVKKIEVIRPIDATVSQFDYANGDDVRQVIYKAKIVAFDKIRDLALLKVRSKLPNTISSKLACESPERGDTAFIVGNPALFYASLNKGIVSSVSRNYHVVMPEESENAEEPLMQVSAGTIGGNSGGAVYNDDGELIGVPVIANVVHETLGWAVPLRSLKSFLKENKLERLWARCK